MHRSKVKNKQNGLKVNHFKHWMHKKEFMLLKKLYWKLLFLFNPSLLLGLFSVRPAFVLCCWFAQQNLPWTVRRLQKAPFTGSKNTFNIWWMTPMKPCGLQISCNVILILVWFPSLTLWKKQSATFSKTQSQGSQNVEERKYMDNPKIDLRKAMEKNLTSWNKVETAAAMALNG